MRGVLWCAPFSGPLDSPRGVCGIQTRHFPLGALTLAALIVAVALHCRFGVCGCCHWIIMLCDRRVV